MILFCFSLQNREQWMVRTIWNVNVTSRNDVYLCDLHVTHLLWHGCDASIVTCIWRIYRDMHMTHLSWHAYDASIVTCMWHIYRDMHMTHLSWHACDASIMTCIWRIYRDMRVTHLSGHASSSSSFILKTSLFHVKLGLDVCPKSSPSTYP